MRVWWIIATSDFVVESNGLSLGGLSNPSGQWVFARWECQFHFWLVFWNMKFMIFHILGSSSSQLTFIFFRGVGQPPISMFLDPNFTLHSDLTSSQDLFRRRPIIFVHDLHKYSPIISPDAPWCYIVYLPTKLAPLWGKCWYIFHTWSIWDPISSYAQVAIWSAAWTAARTTLNGAVLGWFWGVIKSNGFGVPQNHPKTSLRPHCDLTGTMVNKGNHPQMALI